MFSRCRPNSEERRALLLMLLVSLSLSTIPSFPMGHAARAHIGTPQTFATQETQQGLPATAQTIYAINSGNQLIRFSSDMPNTTQTVGIPGHEFSEEIVALDFRPLTGELYGLGIEDLGPGADNLRIYRINASTGASTLLNTTVGLSDKAFYGFDFDPQTDQIRVVNSADQNLRFNPVTGSLISGDINLNDPAGAETVVGLASDRSDSNPSTLTTAFGIDTSVNRLVRLGSVNGTPSSPNDGVLTAVGPLGVNSGSNHVGFDITGADAAYASMQNLLSGAFNLYTVNLMTGQATVVGTIGNGASLIRGIAIQPPAELVVTNTNDTGPGSLRAAINLANNLPGPNTINFNIPGAGVKTISPASPLPEITDPVVIDGYTQPGSSVNTLATGSNAVILIEISGANIVSEVNGLIISAGSSTVRGLVINRWSFNVTAVLLKNKGGNTIAGCFVGPNAAGTALLRQQNGVEVSGSPNNLIGGTTPAARNLISGNFLGVIVHGAAATSNRIQGNYIGTDRTGTVRLQNNEGVDVFDAPSNLIGGANPGEGNVISGNTDAGVIIVNATGNAIQGNLIGTDATGTAKLINGGGVGILDAPDSLVGGSVPGARNVISGNGAGVGVQEAPGTRIQGNFIGTDINGINPLGNQQEGIDISEFNTAHGRVFVGPGNVIAFNGAQGVRVRGSILNPVRLNSIHSNGGLGIDLFPFGPTPNDVGDSDGGANNLQNFPVLTAATSSNANSSTTLQGNLNSRPNTTYFIDFYATSSGAGDCEGRAYFDTSFVMTDAGGNASFSSIATGALAPGTLVSATATTASTLPEGDTSEFSPCIAVSSVGPTPTPTPTSGTALQFSATSHRANEDAGFIQVTVTRSGDVNSAATVDYATTDGTANDRADYTTSIGRLRFAAGETAKSFLVFLTDDHHVESEETLQVALSNPTGAALGTLNTTTLTIVDNDFASVGNPIDETAFFVRQHYIEFLNRAPDPDGFAYWVSNIESCGGDQSCREIKRTDTSAAFFLSMEFQETGFLVHRLFRVGLNRLPRYREFIRDARELGRGVVVGRTGWEAQLEANQQSLAAELVARPEFTLAHGALSNEQFVDALNANTGGSLSLVERNTLIAGLNGGTETRASVLLKIAEDADFISRERNRAFVLAQYFAYLRRNPDDQPDSNFSGFDFWLAKLNEFAGDFRKADMVKAFLLSTEYRARFAPQ